MIYRIDRHDGGGGCPTVRGELIGRTDMSPKILWKVILPPADLINVKRPAAPWEGTVEPAKDDVCRGECDTGPKVASRWFCLYSMDSMDLGLERGCEPGRWGCGVRRD
jgi:hypothetical protein